MEAIYASVFWLSPKKYQHNFRSKLLTTLLTCIAGERQNKVCVNQVCVNQAPTWSLSCSDKG